MSRQERCDPTPEQIAAECRRIQQNWTPRDFRVRAGMTLRRLEIRRVTDPLQHLVRQ